MLLKGCCEIFLVLAFERPVSCTVFLYMVYKTPKHLPASVQFGLFLPSSVSEQKNPTSPWRLFFRFVPVSAMTDFWITSWSISINALKIDIALLQSPLLWCVADLMSSLCVRPSSEGWALAHSLGNFCSLLLLRSFWPRDFELLMCFAFFCCCCCKSL